MRTSGTTQTAFGWRETWIDARRAANGLEFTLAAGSGRLLAHRIDGKTAPIEPRRSGWGWSIDAPLAELADGS
jgi:hypothetical protein